MAEESGGAWMTATAWIVVEPLLTGGARAGGPLRKPKKVAEAARKIARDRWDDLLSDVRQPDGTIECRRRRLSAAAPAPSGAHRGGARGAAPATAAPAPAPSPRRRRWSSPSARTRREASTSRSLDESSGGRGGGGGEGSEGSGRGRGRRRQRGGGGGCGERVGDAACRTDSGGALPQRPCRRPPSRSLARAAAAAFEQLPNGTLTERGVSSTSPVVVLTSADGSKIGEKGSSEEARELAALRLRLRRAVDAADERGHQAALEELGSLLRLSHKESITCFVFSSTAELHACRDEMLGVWHEVVTALEERTIGYGCRAASYEVVTQLLRRDELGCTLHDASDGGAGHTPLHQILRWRALSQRTLAWVLSIVGQPPAGGDGPALRDLCAAVMAASYFRLPRFALALLDALQTPDVLTASIPEWRGISSELDCAPELRDLAEVGMAERPPLDQRQLERRAADALAGATSLYDRGSGVERPSAEAVAEGEAAAAALVDAVASQAWRTRLQRRGMFCRLVAEWLQTVCDSLERSTPPHLRRLGSPPWLPDAAHLHAARDEIAGGR